MEIYENKQNTNNAQKLILLKNNIFKIYIQ